MRYKILVIYKHPHQIHNLKEDRIMATKKADADARKFKASMKELALQLKQSEHRVRAKEMVLDRLKVMSY